MTRQTSQALPVVPKTSPDLASMALPELKKYLNTQDEGLSQEEVQSNR